VLSYAELTTTLTDLPGRKLYPRIEYAMEQPNAFVCGAYTLSGRVGATVRSQRDLGAAAAGDGGTVTGGSPPRWSAVARRFFCGARVHADTVWPVPRSPKRMSRALAMITPVGCERYDAIRRGEVLTRRTNASACSTTHPRRRKFRRPLRFRRCRHLTAILDTGRAIIS
jgi:hypothetical protein